MQCLQEQDRRKDEFLATLAHEFRNPLAPIRNGLQIMRLADTDASAVEQIRLMIERQVGQMVHLIDDLLDLSRISRDKIDYALNGSNWPAIVPKPSRPVSRWAADRNLTGKHP